MNSGSMSLPLFSKTQNLTPGNDRTRGRSDYAMQLELEGVMRPDLSPLARAHFLDHDHQRVMRWLAFTGQPEFCGALRDVRAERQFRRSLARPKRPRCNGEGVAILW